MVTAQERPDGIRALGVLLTVETLVLALFTVLALVSAAIGWAARDQGGFGDIAAALSLVAALVGAVLVVLAGAALLAVRRRRRSAVALSVALHVLPVAFLLAVRASVGSLGGLVVGCAVVAVAGLALTLWPSSRDWFAG